MRLGTIPLLLLLAAPSLQAQQQANEFIDGFLRSYQATANARLMRAEQQRAEAEARRAHAEAKLLEQQSETQAAKKAQMEAAALEQAKAEVALFEKRHPDWRRHEFMMTAFASKALPADGTTEQEWLEMLYALAQSPLGQSWSAAFAKQAAQQR